MPPRHVGKVETQFHSFLTSALDTNVSGQLHASVLYTRGIGLRYPFNRMVDVLQNWSRHALPGMYPNCETPSQYTVYAVSAP